MLVVTNSTQLGDQRRLFERQMGELVTLVKEQTSCHQAIAESLAELKVFDCLLFFKKYYIRSLWCCICVKLGTYLMSFCLYLGDILCFVAVLPNFLSTSQEIGWEQCLQNGLLCVGWDVKP